MGDSTPIAFIAAVAPKGLKGDHGYNRTCNKCKVLLRASFTAGIHKDSPKAPDCKTFCGPCYSKERSKDK